MKQVKKNYVSPQLRYIPLSHDVVTLSSYNTTLDVVVKDGGVWNFGDEVSDTMEDSVK